MEQLRVLVKVGESARTILRNCKAIRAITVDEMQYYLQTENIDLLIVEKVNSEDCDRTSNIIDEYLHKNENPGKVIFNADSSDDDTLGIADEFSCDIVNSTEGVWEYIQSNYGVYVGRDISIIAKDVEGTGLASSDLSSLFGSEVVASNYEDDEDIKLPSLNSKSDLQEFDETTISEIVREQRRRIELIKAHVNGTADLDVSRDDETSIDNPFGSDTDSESTESYENDRDQLDVEDEPKISSKSSSILLAQINKLNDTVARLQGKIEDAQARLDKEVKLRSAVQDERDSLKARLSAIVSTKKVLEERVPASEYRKIISKYTEVQEQLEHMRSESSTLANENSAKVTEYKKQIEDLKRKVNSKEAEIDRLNNAITSSANTESANSAALNAKIDSLNSSLSASKDELAEANRQIDALKAKLDDSEKRLAVLDRTEHHVEVSDKAIAMQSEIIENILAMLRDYAAANFDKEQYVNELQSSLKDEQDRADGLTSIVADKDAKIERLNSSIEELNRKVDEANANVQAKTAELSAENISLRAKLKTSATQISTLRNQITSKDNQYKVLAKSVGPTDPTTGQPRIFANCKMLEAKNKELTNQVFTLNQQLNTALTESQEALKDHKRLVTENANLKRSLSAYIGGGYSGGTGGNGQMVPITYTGANGRAAKIIAVFGTGSFGISLVAFSMAQKLAVQNSVLLMDLDIATPKLDSYFRTLPFVNVPGVPNKTTALELFLSQGVRGVWANATTVIPQKVSNKNGKLWWFPGLYTKADDTAILTADWTDLFKHVGGSFDYIVIDCGKFGYGGPSDQLTQNICRIAYKVVAVSGNDYADVNSTVRAMHNKISHNNLVWILNKVPTTNVTSVVKSLLGNDGFELLPYSNESFGKRMSLSMDKMLRGRFEGFLMNYIIPPKNKVGEV